MLWKLVLAVGLVAASALLYAGANAQIADAPMPPRAAYLMWSALATLWITLVATWLTAGLAKRPRDRDSIRSTAITLVASVVLWGIGLAAVHIATGRPRTPAHVQAIALMLAGIALVSLVGGLTGMALRRRDRRAVSA